MLQRVEQADPMRPEVLCLALRPRLKRFGETFEGEGRKRSRTQITYLLALWRPRPTRLELMPFSGASANTIRVNAFLQRGRDDINIVTNPAKTMMLPPKGHASTAEQISLVGSVHVRIAEGGVAVVGVPICTDK